MQKTVIINAHVISPDVDLPGAAIVIEGQRIKGVLPKGPTSAEPAKDCTVVDVRGKYVMPGFIDVHAHGALGCDFCDKDPQAVFEIAKAKLQEGVTTLFPTTLAVPRGELMTAAKNAKAYAEAGMPYAKVPGIHLEGPFINPACCGAQNPKYVRTPSIKEIKEIAKVYPVLQVSYAPEIQGGAKFAKDCLKLGAVPSCGHSAATFAELMAAYKNGLRHMTHLGNQMTKLHHREIGIVGAGFLVDDLDTEVICDKIHLCADMLKLVFTKRDLAHIQMITDSLRCSHCADGTAFEMGGLKALLKNGEARLVKSGNLAGSTIWMALGLKNVREVTGIPLANLVRTTSWNQALEHGWGQRLGKVEKGFLADLVVIDPKTWRPAAVFVDGVQKV